MKVSGFTVEDKYTHGMQAHLQKDTRNALVKSLFILGWPRWANYRLAISNLDTVEDPFFFNLGNACAN